MCYCRKNKNKNSPKPPKLNPLVPPVVVVGFAVVSGLIPLRFRPLPVLVDVPVPRPVPVPKLELELGKPKLNPLDILTFYYLLS